MYHVTITSRTASAVLTCNDREDAVNRYCQICTMHDIEPVFGLIDCSATNGEVTVTLKQIESK